MAEVGEKSKNAKDVKAVRNGKIKVSVRDACTFKRIEGATVVVNGETQTTAKDEDLIFSDQSTGAADVKVSKHFEDAGYLTFLVHNIALANKSITRSWKAISSDTDLVFVEEGDKPARSRVELPVYKVIESIRFCRDHLTFDPELDYGHWWIEIGDRSYGWYPEPGHLSAKNMEKPVPPAPLSANATMADKITHMVQRAAYAVNQAHFSANNSKTGLYAQAIGKTLKGVPGILNGDEDQKRLEQDSHHEFWRIGKTDEDYHPVVVDCCAEEELHEAIRDFAFAYSGNWSWILELGNNCHTFQVKAMNTLKLDKVKKIQKDK